MPIPPRGYPGVFLAYASDHGTAFIDRALYLPREWTRDWDRRVEAGIPKAARFATKIVLAQRMLARAFGAGVPARWVVADSGYGRSHRFRQWLEKRGRAYAVMVPKTNAIYYCGGRERVEQLGARLTAEAWVSIGGGAGAQGERVHDWACLPLSEQCADGMRRWLLVRRDSDDPDAPAYWLAYGPTQTTIEELVQVCDVRWQIERVPSGQIRTGERGGGDGPLRGTHLGSMAPVHHALPARARPPRCYAGAGAGRPDPRW